MLRCVAFDCFGTVFDMSPVPRMEVSDYVRHVRKNDFTPYNFPESWQTLQAHPDSREGIEKIRRAGICCVALSNGSVELIRNISKLNFIEWDHIVDLIQHQVYKPNIAAYRTVEIDLNILPAETLMVTANPTFGDLEGAEAIGMRSQLVRNGFPATITELASLLGI